MNLVVSHFKKLDWPMAAAAVLLAGAGLVSLYSTSLRSGNFGNFTKQAAFWALDSV